MQAAFSGLQTFFKGAGEGRVQRGLQDVNDVKLVSQKGSSAGRDDEPAFRCFLWQWLCAHPPFPSARPSRASITVFLAARCDRYASCSAPQNARRRYYPRHGREPSPGHQLWSFRTSQGSMVLRDNWPWDPRHLIADISTSLENHFLGKSVDNWWRHEG
jgi:hypothetical protein